MKPRIGIPTPTTIDLPYNQRSWPAYAQAVSLAGGDPIEIPLICPPAELEALIATCHGFLLPGSPADVEPSLYDTPRIPACGPQDIDREHTDFALLAYAAATGKPLLGICYGCQSMNVFHGGSLIQDLSPLPVNHSAGASVAIAHSVLIPRDSLLASTLLASPETAAELSAGSANPTGLLRRPVNTSHHQSVAICANSLRIVARCPDDGVIEAIELAIPETSTPLPAAASEPADPTMFHVEHPRRFLLGVQWHPERSYTISPASRALFHTLITEAQPFTATPRTSPTPYSLPR
jgi:putative glutamine amidotransferase